MQQVTLKDFLTDDQIKLASNLSCAYEICQEIIKPNLDAINQKLGQVNDPMYLAYAVEHVINQSRQIA